MVLQNLDFLPYARILGHIDGRIGIKHGIALVSLGNEGQGRLTE